ncbi:MAG: hypothetical protein LBC69_01360 [Eubacteriaceae bacterium]|jgi:NACalpha-BTF3-like transcription factor|nr:hypothetical protein [Eubacteriaceae bacterium]
MRHVEKDIRYLSHETGFSRKKCLQVLKASNYDTEKALGTLKKLKNSLVEVTWDKISSYIYGEKARYFFIYDSDKLIMRFPAILPIVFVLIPSVPKWLVAVILFMIVVFDMDVRTDQTDRKVAELDAAIVTKKAEALEAETAVKELKESSDGFYEYTIK